MLIPTKCLLKNIKAAFKNRFSFGADELNHRILLLKTIYVSRFEIANTKSSIKGYSKRIIDRIINTYVLRENNKSKVIKEADICIFCSFDKNITKEHVIPRWLFDGCTKKDFITNINGIRQTYNKTTVPTCSTCNTDLLNELEKYITALFRTIDFQNNFFKNEEIVNIIRWLEIIEYKFQILNIKRTFLTSKENGFIPYLADFPISLLRSNKEYSPSKVVSEIRRAQRRITVKNKSQNLYSLVIFKTTNPGFHFFHTMDEFIFIELPKYKIALFYFFNKKFETPKDAYIQAMKIIETSY